jgi:phage-related protein
VTHWFPFLPLVLGASDAFAAFTITVLGDVESWPVITVVGPGQQIVCRNLTTGKSWTVQTTLGAGQKLVVDTRPGRKLVTIDGANAYPLLTADSSLWPLEPGPNRVELAVALTTVATLGTFLWRNAWLAA